MNIIGHGVQLAQLEQDLVADNIAHAYLFSGPRHLGKLTIAKWFGKKILCMGEAAEDAQHIEEQCDRLIHPDFLILDTLWIQGITEDWDHISRFSNIPQYHRSKSKAKTDAISIDDIRSIQDRLADTASGRSRICIIRSAERMQDPAANALLKMLEEPLPGRVFILTTQSAHSLLPTMRSRLRHIHYGCVNAKEMSPLTEGMTEDERNFLIYLAQGAPGTIMAYRNNPDMLRNARMIHEQARLFWKTTSPAERLKILDRLTDRSEVSDALLMSIGLTLREIHSSSSLDFVRAYSRLVAELQYNTNRPLLLQQFALSIASS